MQIPEQKTRTILITGGTSGLGLEMARIFLNKGYSVVVTGRNPASSQISEHRYSYFKVEFSNLEETAAIIKKICRYYSFDMVIDNAGVLSPPDFTLTDDNLEYSFEVNFLANLLVNEIIIRNTDAGHPLTVAAITSLVYRIAPKDLISGTHKNDYKPLKAYSNSKLYLALMCSYLPARYPNMKLNCIGIDPGVFSSGIYRMQKPWFRLMYRIAAPLMRNPRNVATSITELLERNNLENGSVYNLYKRVKPVPGIDHTIKDLFWKDCYNNINKFLED
jgi:NAD(P)-dependent dehydrogenase (short-subunit alcohol dehydrogenase family)